MKRKGDSTDIQTGSASQIRRAPLWKRVWNEKVLYLILLPTMLYFIFFKVLPIINMRLAFFDFKARGPWEFAGLKYFKLIYYIDESRQTIYIADLWDTRREPRSQADVTR